MRHYAIPAVGTPVLVTLPHPYGAGTPIPYRVAEAHDRQASLFGELPSEAPRPPSGVPCLLRWDVAGVACMCDAIVLAAGATALVLDVARDPRRHPRYRRPCQVRLEIPGGRGGVVTGVLEDVSMGGMRVHIPVEVPVDQRVFVTLLLGQALPIMATATVRGVHHAAGSDGLVARLQFVVMAPTHQARLAALLEWPLDAPLRGRIRAPKRRGTATSVT